MQPDTTTGIGARVAPRYSALFHGRQFDQREKRLDMASGLTLVDKIHVMVLVYLAGAVIVTVASRVLLDRRVTAADIAALNYRAGRW